MKLVNYTCDVCGAEVEEYYGDTERGPDVLDKPCPECDSIGSLKWDNLKRNPHRWNWNDRGGL